MNCPNCHRTMIQGKDKIMPTHSRETRKRPYKCECGAKVVEVWRRYPGEAFELHRTDRK